MQYDQTHTLQDYHSSCNSTTWFREMEPYQSKSKIFRSSQSQMTQKNFGNNLKDMVTNEAVHRAQTPRNPF